jgi:hypothetical protein
MNNVTVLFPGGFKPITGAHMHLANQYANNPAVSKVIMLIGPNTRDGVTREKSIDIFRLLNDNPKIEIQETPFPSPILAAYEYLFALPADTVGDYALAASNKDDDYVRVKGFISNVEKYKLVGDKKGRTIPAGVNAEEINVAVDPLKSNGQPISATTTRNAIQSGDYETFARQYPQYDDAIVKNLWQIFGQVTETIFSVDWWKQQLSEDIKEIMGGGYPTQKQTPQHGKKIKKLRSFLNKSAGDEFVYDFGNFNKTVFGVPLTEGGLGGHMNHPYDRYDLTFNDMKEMIARGLTGRLDVEQSVTEKTDGQNIFVTYKNGQVGFARNGGERKTPLSADELADKFAGRGAISDAFREAGRDLDAALSKLGQERLNEIFKNGSVFANMEIIYPATRNIVAYETAVLQFHNLTEYDAAGNEIMTDMPGGAALQRAIQDANSHLQKTFQIIPPRELKLGQVDNFEDYQDALFNEVDQLRNRYGLSETDLVFEYHKAWWKELIEAKAKELGYDIPEQVLTALIKRWSIADKSLNKTALKKMIDNDQFLNWVVDTDVAANLKKIQYENIQPFESIFLKLGALILQNVSNFVAVNPSKAVQTIRKDLADSIRLLKSSNNIKDLQLLQKHLARIQALGGFDKIVPLEGIVFTYGGNTYKLTGSFAPINQLIGVLKYSR